MQCADFKASLFLHQLQNKFAFDPCGLYYKHCYAPSVIVSMIVKHASVCSVPDDHNYSVSKAEARLLAKLRLGC
jgi:hypothetical protein